MALVAGVGPALFVLLFFGVLLLLVYVFASALRYGPAIIAGSTVAYVLLALVLFLSPREDEVEDDDTPKDSRMSNTIVLMTLLGLTAICASVAVCTTQLAKPILAKPL